MEYGQLSQGPTRSNSLMKTSKADAGARGDDRDELPTGRHDRGRRCQVSARIEQPGPGFWPRIIQRIARLLPKREIYAEEGKLCGANCL